MAIQAWYESAVPSSRGRYRRYSTHATTMILVIKRTFRLPQWTAQGCMDSILP
ncbi:transposase [Edwardsiella tarda]|nr:transposase [Edwardsiella tarda]